MRTILPLMLWVLLALPAPVLGGEEPEEGGGSSESPAAGEPARATADAASGRDAGHIWFYVDDQGHMSFCDSLEQVPPRFRAGAQQTSIPSGSGAAPASAPAGSRPVASPAPATAPQPEPGPAPAQPSRKEKLEQLRSERAEVEQELAALEEGWGEDISDEDLEERSERLLRRLEVLDRRIADLERRKR